MTFRADFVNTFNPVISDVLGDEVIYTPNGGGPETIKGIFAAEFEALLDDDIGIDGSVPMFEYVEGVISNPTRDLDTIEFESVVYLVRDIQPSTKGTVKLLLEEM